MTRNHLHQTDCVIVFLCLMSPMTAFAEQCQLARAGTLQIEVVDKHILVKSRINDYETYALYGGSIMSSIFPRAVEDAGLKVKDTKDVKAVLDGDSDPVRLARVSDVKFGDFSVKNQTWNVSGDAAAGNRIAGMVLGEDILRSMEVEIDLGKGNLTLWQPKDCKNSPLAYWTDDFMSVKLLPHHRGLFETEVLLNGIAFRAVVDAGAEQTMVSRVAADSAGGTIVGKDDSASSMRVAVDTSGATIVRFDTFEMGDLTVKNARILVANLEEHVERQIAAGLNGPVPRFDNPGLYIGADFLRAMRVFISKSQGYAYMTYNGGPIFQPENVLPPDTDRFGTPP